ncbi:MAG: hypothetical protein AWM53_00570 [Candidatus Dichloromethanomonas elyunquensis]|nr:MAG: hypothetical protein AWM53_00570 [Candidatus Dichloromethanomonas elyunquensis]
MLEELTLELMGLYRQDLRDYREILDRMTDYQLFLEKRENGNRTKKDESPSSLLLAKIDDDFEKELLEFSVCREDIFNRLQDRKRKSDEIRGFISQETGIAFDVSGLKAYLNEPLHQEFLGLTASLQNEMTEVLKKDEVILPRLKMELQSIKVELHRIQGAKRTKNAYENPGQRESRFIDKTK